MTRKYSSISVQTTLASGISNSATTMTVATGAGAALLGGVTLASGNIDTFSVAIDPDTQNEEIVFITANSGDSFTIVRGQSGSSAISHSGGATVKHVFVSEALNAFEAGLNETIPLNNQTGTTYTLVASDAGDLVTLTNASAITLTVPTNASVPFATGTQITITRAGSGSLTVVGDTGVTVSSADNFLKLRAQWSSATLIKTGTNSWILIGDISA
jgi:uncharacterized protein RhaS with RHS repeats